VSSAELETLVVNGWLIVAHPLFLDALEDLTAQVEKLAEKDPVGYRHKKVTKRLAAIRKLAFEDIPADPASPAFRQGSTLGADHSHWFRAKFFQQYRLFFRYHQASRVIVLAWVNDDDTLRAYESTNDAYRTFRRMLDAGNPPTTWSELLKQAMAAQGQLQALTHDPNPEFE
jgi:toxin YhaV